MYNKIIILKKYSHIIIIGDIMIVVNKKRILLIIFALVMSISISQISGNNIENSNNYMDSIENTKMVNAVPVSNK